MLNLEIVLKKFKIDNKKKRSKAIYLTIRGGSLKNIAKNIIPNVPTNKKVYTNASI